MEQRCGLGLFHLLSLFLVRQKGSRQRSVLLRMFARLRRYAGLSQMRNCQRRAFLPPYFTVMPHPAVPPDLHGEYATFCTIFDAASQAIFFTVLFSINNHIHNPRELCAGAFCVFLHYTYSYFRKQNCGIDFYTSNSTVKGGGSNANACAFTRLRPSILVSPHQELCPQVSAGLPLYRSHYSEEAASFCL